MPKEVRRDTDVGWQRGGVFLLSFLAGFPLAGGLMFLTGGNLPVLPAVFLFPAVTLIMFWRRGHRCRSCGGRCEDLDGTADSANQWRYHCPRCDIEWRVDKPDCGAAA